MRVVERIYLTNEDIIELVKEQYKKHELIEHNKDGMVLELTLAKKDPLPSDDPTEFEWFIGEECGYSENSIDEAKESYKNNSFLEFVGIDSGLFHLKNDGWWDYIYHPKMHEIGIGYWKKKMDDLREQKPN